MINIDLTADIHMAYDSKCFLANEVSYSFHKIVGKEKTTQMEIWTAEKQNIHFTSMYIT